MLAIALLVGSDVASAPPSQQLDILQLACRELGVEAAGGEYGWCGSTAFNKGLNRDDEEVYALLQIPEEAPQTDATPDESALQFLAGAVPLILFVVATRLR